MNSEKNKHKIVETKINEFIEVRYKPTSHKSSLEYLPKGEKAKIAFELAGIFKEIKNNKD